MRRGFLLLALLTLAACGKSTPTTPAPLAPRPAEATICTPEPGEASMGISQRCKAGLPLLAFGTPPGQTGLDLSNNDPIYGQANWRTVRRHDSFVYLKVTEGTGFVDTTAARMAREAKGAGLYIGGYGFMHVCGDSPTAEARFFMSHARSDGLLKGKGVLPATADFELGTGCNAKAWLGAWTATVSHETHTAVYSDQGYYVPSVGCFRGANYGWVANLGGFAALCELPTILQQYSWSASNGVTRADGDVYRGSYAGLTALANAKPAPSPLPALYARRRALRRVLVADGCRARVRRHEHLGPKCKRWFAEGVTVNRKIHELGGH